MPIMLNLNWPRDKLLQISKDSEKFCMIKETRTAPVTWPREFFLNYQEQIAIEKETTEKYRLNTEKEGEIPIEEKKTLK